MCSFRLSCASSLQKTVISGMLARWVHVLIDGANHRDVQVFWPCTTTLLWEILRRHLSGGYMRIICVASPLAAVVHFVAIARGADDPPEGKRSADRMSRHSLPGPLRRSTAMMLDALPGSPGINENGHIKTNSAATWLLCMALPIVTGLGYSGHICFKYLSN